jgi:FkbM family methyltransferase
MRSPLDYVLGGSGTTVAERMLEPLARAGISPLVVDVGARNGMLLLPQSYTRQARLVSFEPNAVEHEKLVSGQTDAARVGAHAPKFRSTDYYNCALWSEDAKRTFYVTEGPGACTMMGETLPNVSKNLFHVHVGRDSRSGRSFYECHGKVKERLPVACRRLDGILGAQDTVDFLKIDVEGGELEVLKGAEGLLSERRVLFIYAEFSAMRLYEHHALLGDLHVFLDRYGFRLIDLDLNHPPYTRSMGRLPKASDRALLQAGDAFFALDPDLTELTPIARQRIAIMSSIFWFNSLSLGLLREAGLMDASDIDAIEQAWQRPPLRRWAKQLWKEFPRKAADFARRALRGFR